MWKDHAIATAEVLNKINPHFIRLRSLRIPQRVPLSKEINEGQFVMQDEDMVVEELKLFIENIEGIKSRVTSDHMMNLLEEIEGRLSEDKKKMLDVIDRYQSLSDADRLIFRVGRRGGAYSSTYDLENDPAVYSRIKNLIHELEKKGGTEGVENFITEMVDRYI